MKWIITLISVVLAPAAMAMGGMVGNGGDTLLCAPSSNNTYSGLYALDYLMTIDQRGDSALVVPDTWQGSLDRIQQMLATQYPPLADSLAQFRLYLTNTTDWTQPRIWLDAPQGLINLNDQSLTRKIPANCGGQDATSGINVIQTVVREKKQNILQYEVDYSAFQQLQNSPLQFSFLLIHEWLWDLTDDPQVIRLANQFLHSQNATTLSPANFKLSLNNIGVAARRSDFVSFCDRSPAIQKYYTAAAGKTCDLITQTDLDNLPVRNRTALTLAGQGISALNVNDFSGLDFLTALDLSYNNLQTLPSEIFDGLPSLSQFSLVGNQLSALDKDIFAKLTSLKTIALNQNLITSLPADLFAQNAQLASVQLGTNQLASLPNGFFSFVNGSTSYLNVGLEKNLFSSFPPGFFCQFKGAPYFNIELNDLAVAEKNRIQQEISSCNARIQVKF